MKRARLTLQEAGHVLQLRDVVLPVAAVLLQQGEDAVVFVAGVSRVQGLQLLEHRPPRQLLRLRVLHLGDDLATGTHVLLNKVCIQGSDTCGPMGVQDRQPNLHDQIFCEIIQMNKNTLIQRINIYINVYFFNQTYEN